MHLAVTAGGAELGEANGPALAGPPHPEAEEVRELLHSQMSLMRACLPARFR